MPWNSQLATMLVAAEAARYITSSEYEMIRSSLQGETITNQATDVAQTMNKEAVSPKPKFILGAASLKELQGVKPELVAVVKRAIEITTQDFTVFDGIRTLKEQQQHVKNGTSQTMKSKHLDGLAVDLVPWVDGKPVWDWDKIYAIACAMDAAATEQGCASKIRWGGAWDRTLADFGGQPSLYFDECQAYQKRHPGSDFIDGPHFEWVG